MSRWIDAEWLMNFFEPYPNDYQTPLGSLRACVDDAPSIETKQIKYFDEDENVWKVGSVIVNDSEKPNNLSEKPTSSTISKMEQVDKDINVRSKDKPQAEIKGSKRLLKGSDEPQQKSCATCKHALGNWDGESNNCGRCCGADRRFYEPKDEPQTERSE